MVFCVTCVERNEDEKERVQKLNKNSKAENKVPLKLIREGRIRCKRNYPFGKQSKPRAKLLFCRTCKDDEFAQTRDDAIDVINKRNGSKFKKDTGFQNHDYY